MQIESWLAFCSIAFIATVTPGPAILLVTTHSLQYGLARSVITITGNISGLFIMSVCSVLGLSALVLYSSLAFTTIKVLGALYLFYLGIKLWKNGVQKQNSKQQNKESSNPLSLYAQGLLVSITNPKAIVFTTALFPQFIVTSEPLAPQFTTLVLTFMTFSFLCLFSYAGISHRAKRSSHSVLSGKTLGKLFGSTFIGASAVLATSVNR